MTLLRVNCRLLRKNFTLHVDFSVPLNGITAIFGPSGCGKTTLLRCIAGLEKCQGTISLGETNWQNERGGNVAVHQRDIGFVFQEPRLFEHLSVQGNLDYGWKRTPHSLRQISVSHVIDVLGVGHLLSRKPNALSLGEQQRIAIGRALLCSPKLLLMDEPLASLDLTRKRELLPYINRLAKELHIPIVYVSHAVSEIIQLADRVLMLRDGELLKSGDVNDFLHYLDLYDEFKERRGAVINTVVDGHETQYGLSRLCFNQHLLYVPHCELPKGSPVRVYIAANNVTLALAPPQTPISVLNILSGKVVAIEQVQTGHASLVTIDIGSNLVARITNKSIDNLKLTIGQTIYAYIKAVSLAESVFN